jgi:hypothetical protein
MAAPMALATLAACDGAGPPPPAEAPKAETEASGGYVAAPTVTGARAAGGEAVLEGTAKPGARVRLGEPRGGETFAVADGSGRWRMRLPAPTAPKIFGLSMTMDGRLVQAQGYILLTPDGRAVLLRAGAGASAPGEPGSPRIAAFDFDREGGAVVSGVATPNAALSVRVDGRPSGAGRSGADGRFNLALAQPITGGVHQIEIVGDAFRSAVAVDARPAAPLAAGPFRAVASADGLRADWLTPGGGLQSTWILN